MVDIQRIAGSPGAGKTYTLQQRLNVERKEHNVDVWDFRFVTFTNAATADAADAVGQIYDASREDIETAVRTLHSVAYAEAGKAGVIEDGDMQVISQLSERDKEYNPYQKFADQHGMRYKGRTLQYSREHDVEEGTADALYRLYEWLQLTQRDPEQAREAPFNVPWPADRAATLIHQWDEFKRTDTHLPLLEHVDYLNAVIDRGLFPEVSVLFLDEFQDFSPQEYLYYKKWRDSGLLDRIYLAGDPNQAIYSFRAGSPYYFENTDADEDIELTESHRCRGEVADFARTVLNTSPRDSTDFHPRYGGGTVKQIDGSRDGNIRAAVDSVLTYEEGGFILARTNRKVDSVRRWLHEQGYPYRMLGKRRSVWDDSLQESLNALRGLKRDGGGVPRSDVYTVMAHSPQRELRKEVLDAHGDVFSVDSVWRAFNDMDTVGDIVDDLDYEGYKRTALRNAVLKDHEHEPSSLAVGTIHAAKGLERPGVILFNNSNGHIDSRYNENMDLRAEEHRVAYVGATRAEKRLYIVNDYFDGPAMQPIARARRSGGVSA